MDKRILDFREEIDHILNEIENENENKLLTDEVGPGKDDTIH